MGVAFLFIFNPEALISLKGNNFDVCECLSVVDGICRTEAVLCLQFSTVNVEVFVYLLLWCVHAHVHKPLLAQSRADHLSSYASRQMSLLPQTLISEQIILSVYYIFKQATVG